MSLLSAIPIPVPDTLGSLLTLVETHPALTEAARREMLSAIRTCAKVFKRDPHLIAADPAALRSLMASALPLAVNVSATRYRNAKSLLRRALRLLNPDYIPARSSLGLLPGWRAALDAPEAAGIRRGLARFSKWCSSEGIEPDQVSQAVFERFHHVLTKNGLMRSPRETQRMAGCTWNKAVATLPCWPAVMLEIPSARKNPSLKLADLPASFQADVDAYLTPQTESGFSLAKKAPTLRPATIARNRLGIRQLATALVETGRPINSITCLADLVTIEAAQAALSVFFVRGNGPSNRNHALAYLLLNIARHHAKADQATLTALKIGCDKMRPRRSGMTAKNAKRLAQFNDWRKQAALLGLPEKLMAEARRVDVPTAAEARVAQLAVAIEVLLVAPIRVKNLAELEIGRSLIMDGSAVGHIWVDASEVKNHVGLEIPLPDTTLAMIKLYIKHFHRLLAPPGCAKLFPSRDGGNKRACVLGTQITRCLGKCCGLEMNPHLFRHFVAKAYLTAHPGAYGVIRLLLGHKNMTHTVNAYCGTETDAAFRQWDGHIQKLRDAASAHEGRTKRLRGRA